METVKREILRERKKLKTKSGDAGPEIISCWPLFQVMDFLRETVRHRRLASSKTWIHEFNIFLFLVP